MVSQSGEFILLPHSIGPYSFKLALRAEFVILNWRWFFLNPFLLRPSLSNPIITVTLSLEISGQ